MILDFSILLVGDCIWFIRISNLETHTSQSFTSAKMRSLVLLLAMILTIESALINHTRLRQTRTNNPNNEIFGQQLPKDLVQIFSQWLKKIDMEDQWMTYKLEDKASTQSTWKSTQAESPTTPTSLTSTITKITKYL